MIPDQSPSGPGHTYYPTEVALVEGCTESRLTGLTEDTRYKSLGMDVSVYDVQYHSGVLGILGRQPLIGNYFNAVMGIATTKKNEDTRFFGRHVIPWDLECESR